MRATFVIPNIVLQPNTFSTFIINISDLRGQGAKITLDTFVLSLMTLHRMK